MKYEVTVNRRFSYVRSYKVLKGVKEDTNKVSKMFQALVDKYVLKKQDV